MTEGKCAIWGTDAHEFRNSSADVSVYISSRAGGEYEISDEFQYFLRNATDETKLKLTTWLVGQRLQGIERPKLFTTGGLFEKIQSKALLSVSERMDRYFFYCIKRNIRPGHQIYNFKKSKDGQHNIGLDFEEIYAWTETIDFSEFNFFRQVLKEMGLIQAYVELAGEADFDILTASGYAKLEELERTNKNSKQAFVAMWFDPDDKTIFDEGIRPAIEIDPNGKETGFKALRVDREEYSDFIIDFMIGNIRRSKFVVADFTSFMVKGNKVLSGTASGSEIEDFQIARGGVYYEAGFAKGLGIPVIATCRNDQKDHIHFDLKQFNTIYWEDVADLRTQLSQRIFAMFVT